MNNKENIMIYGAIGKSDDLIVYLMRRFLEIDEKIEYLEYLFRGEDGYSFEHNDSNILMGLGF